MTGGRLDVYPSGMARESGGVKAYKYEVGKPLSADNLVDIFDTADARYIATVDEQKLNWDRYLNRGFTER